VLAIRVLSRIREGFALDLPLKTLFTSPTIAQLASEIERLSGLQTLASLPPLQPRQHEGEIPTSFAQQRLWITDQMEHGVSAYNLPLAVVLSGGGEELPALLGRSVAMVVERHEILRTILPQVNGEPVQKVMAHVEFKLPLVDVSLVRENQQEAIVRRLANVEALRPFHLSTGPLLRAMLVRAASEKHVLLLTLHHIVADGWSLEILFDELIEVYSSLAAGRSCNLPALTVQYGDYAQWQREWLRGELLENLLTFWRSQLADVPAAIRLPTDRPRPAVQTFRGSRLQVAWGAELSGAVKELARNERATPFVVMLAGLVALLYRYTGDEDILIGTPSANRNRVELEGLIGFFSNTLVLRSRIAARDSFRQLVAAVRETVLKAHAHQDLPFEKLVEEMQPVRQLGVSPYFQVVFAMHHAKPARRFEGITLEPLETEILSAKFDLTIYVLRRDGELNVYFEYNRDLFNATTVLRLLENYRNLMAAAATDAGASVSALPLLSAAEAHQVLREWNDTLADYPIGSLIHQLFEAQVARTPESAALLHGDERLTYRELNCMANRIAHGLRALGVGPEKTVAVFLKRSSNMVAALLGILKSGGAYVPLDPEYPAERLAFMLGDAHATLVVTELSLRDRLGNVESRTVLLDDLVVGAPDHNPVLVTDTHNLAYVIYTSGSTGRPKGIMIEHHSAVVLLHWVRETFSQEELAGMLAGTSICFDVSIFELFGALSWGGRVQLIENALEIPSFRDDPEVRLAGSVPSAVAELVAADGIPQWATTLNLAGEPVPSGMAEDILHRSNARRITNLYGPSEDTTFSSIAFLSAGGPQPTPIGRPVANTRFFVLDSEFRFTPMSAVGQIYIAGDGLTRGYIGRPELTAERYLPDPHSGVPGARMYRTGDQARYLMNGELVYLGRLDHQVKIRGFRVELGEIEAVLREYPGVSQAVVTLSAKDHLLAAYIVADHDAQPAVAAIDMAVRSRLPEYMAPSAYMVLESLPLLPNGKIDRSKLPEPVMPLRDGQSNFVAPGSELEEGIAAILQEMLERPHIGVHDHFFSDLGAHSLFLIQLADRLRKQLAVRLSVIELFQFPTIATLAAHLDLSRTVDAPTPNMEKFVLQRQDATQRNRELRKAAQLKAGQGGW
jgi:amino acid adenylation domain-containing protein